MLAVLEEELAEGALDDREALSSVEIGAVIGQLEAVDAEASKLVLDGCIRRSPSHQASASGPCGTCG